MKGLKLTLLFFILFYVERMGYTQYCPPPLSESWVHGPLDPSLEQSALYPFYKAKYDDEEFYLITWSYDWDSAPNTQEIWASYFTTSNHSVIKDKVKVNTTPGGSMLYPNSVSLKNPSTGLYSWFVAWNNVKGSPNYYDIYMRKYDIYFDSNKNDYIATTQKEKDQGLPQMSRLPVSNWGVLVFENYNIDSSSPGYKTYDVMGRIFDSEGEFVTDDFHIAQRLTEYETWPTVSGFYDGQDKFIVAWVRRIKITGGPVYYEIKGRIFNRLGQPLTDEFTIAVTSSTKEYCKPWVAAHSTGFVAVWYEDPKSYFCNDIKNPRVYYRSFKTDGKPYMPEPQLVSESSTKKNMNSFVVLTSWSPPGQRPVPYFLVTWVGKTNTDTLKHWGYPEMRLFRGISSPTPKTSDLKISPYYMEGEPNNFVGADFFNGCTDDLRVGIAWTKGPEPYIDPPLPIGVKTKIHIFSPSSSSFSTGSNIYPQDAEIFSLDDQDVTFVEDLYVDDPLEPQLIFPPEN